jgi:hypothetical protein
VFDDEEVRKGSRSFRRDEVKFEVAKIDASLALFSLLSIIKKVNMLVKLSSFLLLLVPYGAAFRVPDNVQRNVELPKIRDRNVEQVATQDSMLKSNQATVRKRVGVDNSMAEEYWYDSRIHSLGNVGFFGGIHAALAPLTTKLIDVIAYNGTDIRQLVSTLLLFRNNLSYFVHSTYVIFPLMVGRRRALQESKVQQGSSP